MSEDMNRVATPLPPSPQDFTFSNITNASIKIPFKHHAYFSITIVRRSPLVSSTSALPLSLWGGREGGRGDVKGHGGQMMVLHGEKIKWGGNEETKTKLVMKRERNGEGERKQEETARERCVWVCVCVWEKERERERERCSYDWGMDAGPRMMWASRWQGKNSNMASSTLAVCSQTAGQWGALRLHTCARACTHTRRCTQTNTQTP